MLQSAQSVNDCTADPQRTYNIYIYIYREREKTKGERERERVNAQSNIKISLRSALPFAKVP